MNNMHMQSRCDRSSFALEMGWNEMNEREIVSRAVVNDGVRLRAIFGKPRVSLRHILLSVTMREK